MFMTLPVKCVYSYLLLLKFIQPEHNVGSVHMISLRNDSRNVKSVDNETEQSFKTVKA